MSFSVLRQFRDTLINQCGITPAIKALHDDQELMRSGAKNSNERLLDSHSKLLVVRNANDLVALILDRRRMERTSIHKHLKLGFSIFLFFCTYEKPCLELTLAILVGDLPSS